MKGLSAGCGLEPSVARPGNLIDIRTLSRVLFV